MSLKPPILRVPLQEICFAAIDFESAGAEKGQTDAPVQLGLAVLPRGQHTPQQFFRSYIHTEKPITWAAQAVHGITTAELQNAPSLISLWGSVNDTLRNRAVVAHGMGTEKRFLRAFPLHGFGPWVDSLMVSQAVWPDLPKHSLGALGESLNLTDEARKLCPGLGYHDALFDSVVSLLVIRTAIAHAGLAAAPLDVFVKPDRRAYFAKRKQKRDTLW